MLRAYQQDGAGSAMVNYGWTAQTSGTATEMRAIADFSATVVDAAGTSGVGVRTTNAGAAWGALATGTGNHVDSMIVIGGIGFLSGENGMIRTSADNGATWTAQVSSTADELYGITAADPTHLWAVGQNQTIVASTNGTSWATQLSPGSGNPQRGNGAEHDYRHRRRRCGHDSNNDQWWNDVAHEDLGHSGDSAWRRGVRQRRHRGSCWRWWNHPAQHR